MVLPDQDQIKKIEYFQSMYPQNMKMLRSFVVEECDNMDYQGSPMYDEYPDIQVIRHACRRICDRIPDNVISKDGIFSENQWKNMEAFDVEPVEIYEVGPGEDSDMQQQQLNWGNQGSSRPPWGPPPGPGRPPGGPPPGPGRPPWGPPPGSGRPPWGPPHRPGRPPFKNRPGWLQDIVQILFMNEMQNRRCRAGRCW